MMLKCDYIKKVKQLERDLSTEGFFLGGGGGRCLFFVNFLGFPKKTTIPSTCSKGLDALSWFFVPKSYFHRKALFVVGFRRKEGNKERKEGRKEGRKEEGREGRKEGRREGRKEGRKEESKEENKEFQARKKGRKAHHVSRVFANGGRGGGCAPPNPPPPPPRFF